MAIQIMITIVSNNNNNNNDNKRIDNNNVYTAIYTYTIHSYCTQHIYIHSRWNNNTAHKRYPEIHKDSFPTYSAYMVVSTYLHTSAYNSLYIG